MNPDIHSLRLRLLALIALPILGAGLLISGLALGFTYHEIGEIYDAQLVESAKLLLELSVHEISEPKFGNISNDAGKLNIAHDYEKKTAYRIWKGGRIIAESETRGVFGPKALAGGFSMQDVNGDGKFWRTFAYIDAKNNITVEVAEDNDVRTELILQILGSLFLPGLIFLPLIMLFVWRGTTRSLRPLAVLAQNVNRRQPEDLTPLDVRDIPEEVMPLIKALNRLFNRVDEVLRREREFTDNAAHELRTPLAAMKTQAQVLARQTGRFDSAQKEGLDNLLRSIDRATRLVEQMLAFARLQHASQLSETVDLSVLIGDIMRDLFPAALSRRQTLEAEIAPAVRLTGDGGALSILVRNLVDNALKYTPQGGAVQVFLKQEGEKIVLDVRDNGPGIPPEHQPRVFERFYRVHKSDGGGSGLGLAIASWIAEMHGAEMSLENLGGGGLGVRVVFSGRGGC